MFFNLVEKIRQQKVLEIVYLFVYVLIFLPSKFEEHHVFGNGLGCYYQVLVSVTGPFPPSGYSELLKKSDLQPWCRPQRGSTSTFSS